MAEQVEEQVGISASELFGLSLAEAFGKIVLEDPEVGALGTRLDSNDRHFYETICERRLPGPWMTYNWPLALTARGLADGYVHSPFWFPGMVERSPSPAVQRLAEAVARQFHRMKEHLVNGTVAAVGVNALSGLLEAIDRRQWSRRETHLDPYNGDLVEQKEGKFYPRWTGISIVDPASLAQTNHSRSPSNGFHVKPTASDSAPPTTMTTDQAVNSRKRPSAAHASIDEAVSALWPDGCLPKGMLVQTRDKLIIEWQKKNGRVIVSSRTIQRHFRSA